MCGRFNICGIFVVDAIEKYHKSGERGGSILERCTPDRGAGVQHLLPPCGVIEQDSLLSRSTDNTQDTDMTENLLTGTISLKKNNLASKL